MPKATKYPANGVLGVWFHALAERTENKVIKVIQQFSSLTGTLTYHATEYQMREAIRIALLARAILYESRLPAESTSPQIGLSASTASKSPTKKRDRLPSTIHSPAAARKMEQHLETKGIGLTEFAIQAQTTDRTLRRFRKTGKLRRDIFDNVAKAMGTTRDVLLSD